MTPLYFNEGSASASNPSDPDIGDKTWSDPWTIVRATPTCTTAVKTCDSLHSLLLDKSDPTKIEITPDEPYDITVFSEASINVTLYLYPKDSTPTVTINLHSGICFNIVSPTEYLFIEKLIFKLQSVSGSIISSSSSTKITLSTITVSNADLVTNAILGAPLISTKLGTVTFNSFSLNYNSNTPAENLGSLEVSDDSLISLYRSSVYINGFNVNNVKSKGDGGVLSLTLSGSTSFTLRDSKFTNCESEGYGGAIYLKLEQGIPSTDAIFTLGPVYTPAASDDEETTPEPDFDTPFDVTFENCKAISGQNLYIRTASSLPSNKFLARLAKQDVWDDLYVISSGSSNSQVYTRSAITIVSTDLNSTHPCSTSSSTSCLTLHDALDEREDNTADNTGDREGDEEKEEGEEEEEEGENGTGNGSGQGSTGRGNDGDGTGGSSSDGTGSTDTKVVPYIYHFQQSCNVYIVLRNNYIAESLKFQQATATSGTAAAGTTPSGATHAGTNSDPYVFKHDSEHEFSFVLTGESSTLSIYNKITFLTVESAEKITVMNAKVDISYAKPTSQLGQFSAHSYSNDAADSANVFAVLNNAAAKLNLTQLDFTYNMSPSAYILSDSLVSLKDGYMCMQLCKFTNVSLNNAPLLELKTNDFDISSCVFDTITRTKGNGTVMELKNFKTDDSTFVLNNMTFKNCSATGNDAYGGAIYCKMTKYTTFKFIKSTIVVGTTTKGTFMYFTTPLVPQDTEPPVYYDYSTFMTTYQLSDDAVVVEIEGEDPVSVMSKKIIFSMEEKNIATLSAVFSNPAFITQRPTELTIPATLEEMQQPFQIESNITMTGSSSVLSYDKTDEAFITLKCDEEDLANGFSLAVSLKSLIFALHDGSPDASSSQHKNDAPTAFSAPLIDVVDTSTSLALESSQFKAADGHNNILLLSPALRAIGGRISLTSVSFTGLTMDSCSLLEVPLNQYLSLSGVNFNSIVRNSGNGTVFHFTVYSANDIVNLGQASFSNCATLDGMGGAIYIRVAGAGSINLGSGKSLTFSNCSASKGSSAYAGCGGALYVEFTATPTAFEVSDVYVTSGVAESGTVVYATGPAETVNRIAYWAPFLRALPLTGGAEQLVITTTDTLTTYSMSTLIPSGVSLTRSGVDARECGSATAVSQSSRPCGTFSGAFNSFYRLHSNIEMSEGSYNVPASTPFPIERALGIVGASENTNKIFLNASVFGTGEEQGSVFPIGSPLNFVTAVFSGITLRLNATKNAGDVPYIMFSVQHASRLSLRSMIVSNNTLTPGYLETSIVEVLSGKLTLTDVTFSQLTLTHTPLLPVSLSSTTLQGTAEFNFITRLEGSGAVFDVTVNPGEEFSIAGMTFVGCKCLHGNGGAVRLTYNGGILDLGNQETDEKADECTTVFRDCSAWDRPVAEDSDDSDSPSAYSNLRSNDETKEEPKEATDLAGCGGGLYLTVNAVPGDDEELSIKNIVFDGCDAEVGQSMVVYAGTDSAYKLIKAKKFWKPIIDMNSRLDNEFIAVKNNGNKFQATSYYPYGVAVTIIVVVAVVLVLVIVAVSIICCCCIHEEKEKPLQKAKLIELVSKQ